MGTQSGYDALSDIHARSSGYIQTENQTWRTTKTMTLLTRTIQQIMKRLQAPQGPRHFSPLLGRHGERLKILQKQLPIQQLIQLVLKMQKIHRKKNFKLKVTEASKSFQMNKRGRNKKTKKLTNLKLKGPQQNQYFLTVHLSLLFLP